jgi:predicted Rossmann fold flavoprotein
MNQIMDLAVVGAGPAGMMAAITAAINGNRVILIEKNGSAGKKLLITGNGRCNLTNTVSMNDLLKKFQKKGSFLRTAFTRFTNNDLMNFFESRGLKLKVESDGRVFPVTDNSSDVLNILLKELKNQHVTIRYNTQVDSVQYDSKGFLLELDHGEDILAKNVVLATGGISYSATGSDGDGHKIAKETGHKVTALIPGIVPVITHEFWVRELSGLQLVSAAAVIKHSKGKLKLEGDVLFTHQGLTGPMILNNSSKLVEILKSDERILLNIDIHPEKTVTQLSDEFLTAREEHGKVDLGNHMKLKLPNRMIPLFLEMAGADPKLKMNQLGKKERNNIVNLLKSFPLTITGTSSIDKAMVTCGGVSSKDFDPNTMESKLVSGLFFAGELVDGCGPSGGYNLQQAFSTGYLAGSIITS